MPRTVSTHCVVRPSASVWSVALCALATAAGAQPASPGLAPSYPARPVRIIVPFAPGANADLIGRIVAQRVSPMWGQPVVLDHRPGGSTNIGTELAARAPADGYTLLLVVPPIAVNKSLFRTLPFDVLTDFAPIILCTRVPNVMSVHPSVPARTLRELIALAKARPGQLNFDSGGQGSANHMAGELLKLTAGINIVHVPYKGSAPAITDGVGGHVEMIFVGVSSILQLIEAGRLRPLASPSSAGWLAKKISCRSAPERYVRRARACRRRKHSASSISPSSCCPS